MNNRKIIVLSFLLFFIAFNTLCSVNIYKNEQYGIEFEIPDDVIFDKLNNDNIIYKYSDKDKDINEKYILNVQVKSIKDFFKFWSLNLKDNEMNEKNILKIFNKEKSNNKTKDRVIVYNGKVIGGKTWGYLELNQLEVNKYYVWFYIVKGEYVIDIRLTYYDLLTKIPPRYPDYFIKDETNNEWVFKWIEGKNDISTDFMNLAISHSPRAPLELVKLFDYANTIEKSIKLYGNIFNPTIDNLRFRESPTLDGKFIRLLKKTDKLELVEKGKTETINGTTGTWVKVKTEQGEVGWCFDAYLEEVKKK